MQKILKNDKVKIMAGKDSGKEGTVDRVMAKDGKIIVAGINMFKRAVSGRKFGQEGGGIIDITKPINLSNVLLICPSCKKGTRVGFKIEGDSKFRMCKKCGKEIVKG